MEEQIKNNGANRKTFSDVVRNECDSVNILAKNCNVIEQRERKNDVLIIGVSKLKDRENLHKFITAYASVCDLNDMCFNDFNLVRQVEITNKRTDKKRFPITIKSKTNCFKQKVIHKKLLIEQIINRAKDQGNEIEFAERVNGESVVQSFNLLTKQNADLFFQLKSFNAKNSFYTALDTEKGALYIKLKNNTRRHFIYSFSQFLDIKESVGIETGDLTDTA